jgi:hypothetical protein
MGGHGQEEEKAQKASLCVWSASCPKGEKKSLQHCETERRFTNQLIPIDWNSL